MTYETDPRWQKAHTEWLRDRDADETPTDHLMRGVKAAFAMHAIESADLEDIA